MCKRYGRRVVAFPFGHQTHGANASGVGACRACLWTLQKSAPQQGKVFRPRESKLTVMFQTEEFATIYNIFVAVLIILSLETLYEQVRKGRHVSAVLLTVNCDRPHTYIHLCLTRPHRLSRALVSTSTS